VSGVVNEFSHSPLKEDGNHMHSILEKYHNLDSSLSSAKLS